MTKMEEKHYRKGDDGEGYSCLLSLEASAKEPHTQLRQLVLCYSTETRWLF